MVVSTRQVTDITSRRREVARLYCKGWTQPEIAEQLDVHQSTISRDLKDLRKDWLASALMDINEAKARELTKIDILELEYWDAWHRSVGENIRETSKAKGPAQGKPTKMEKTIVKDRLVGDPRFLAGVQWCIDKRCKIMGLDAPQLVEVTWQDELVSLLRSGEIEPEQVITDFGEELAYTLFDRAGVKVE